MKRTPPRKPATAETFGAHVRRERQRRKLTQAETARLAGIDVATLNKIEKGHREDDRGPSLSVIRRLAAALGVPPGQLLS
jgi:transcriptional regulator with XRE-family HTH domain